MMRSVQAPGKAARNGIMTFVATQGRMILISLFTLILAGCGGFGGLTVGEQQTWRFFPAAGFTSYIEVDCVGGGSCTYPVLDPSRGRQWTDAIFEIFPACSVSYIFDVTFSGSSVTLPVLSRRGTIWTCPRIDQETISPSLTGGRANAAYPFATQASGTYHHVIRNEADQIIHSEDHGWTGVKVR